MCCEVIELSVYFVGWFKLSAYAFAYLLHFDGVATVVELSASFTAPTKVTKGSIWTARSAYCVDRGNGVEYRLEGCTV